MGLSWFWFCFFFQAEDGIRDLTVTGVQTCALPILRLRTPLPRPRAIRDPPLPSRSPASGDGGGSSDVTARLEVKPAPDGAVRLVVYAPAAATVELAGDFTDWQPVGLQPTSDGAWESVQHIPGGAHRVNVRIDGGRWTAPAGTTRTTDEFGGEVGIVAVP